MSKVVYKVKGMMCNPGVKATVTLEPAEAVIEFSEKVYDRAGLQSVIIEKAGEYILEDK